MKIINLIYTLIAFSFALNLYSQDKDYLLKVNDSKIGADEFKWLYLKNNPSGQYKTGIDEYLDLYIKLRLKVEAAGEAGIDKRQSFMDELAGYRKQLAKNYLTDEEAKEELLKKSYERYKTEINALHILIRCPADASPADSLEAYNRAMNIRERIRLGEPFESVAKGASDDPTVNINGGNLGYFTVFQTPLAFENAVYGMSPGQLSMPVRTASGYHIIKVQDKRENQGRIKVAHIMKATPPGSTPGQRKKAGHDIDSLYMLLENGADFATLAINNSDDQLSAKNGGGLPWFGPGEMIYEFSVAAFKLLRNNEYTRPVKTVYGWHIIKRLDKEPMPPYEEAKKYLESRLSHSYLLSISRKSFTGKLKKEYGFQTDNTALEWFYPLADSTFRFGKSKDITAEIPEKDLYTFADEKCTMNEFAEFIRHNGNQGTMNDSVSYIRSLLEQKIYNHLLEYEDANLEDKYPEFRYLMNEFYDGILFFEITDSLIWQKSADSTGLAEYYNTRKEEFMEGPMVTARIFTIEGETGKRLTRKIIKTIKKYHNRNDYREIILQESVTGKDSTVIIEEGTWRKGENDLLDRVKWSKGIHQLTTDNGTILVDITELTGVRPKELEQVKGIIINDYQNYLEEKWVNELRRKYEVSINRELLKEVKTDIGK